MYHEVSGQEETDGQYPVRPPVFVRPREVFRHEYRQQRGYNQQCGRVQQRVVQYTGRIGRFATSSNRREKPGEKSEGSGNGGAGDGKRDEQRKREDR